MRILLSLALAVAVLAIGVAGYIIYDRMAGPQTISGEGLVITGTKLGGPFSLTDENGKAVTQAAFAGKYTLVYFGYSFCPDICPTGLQTMAEALDQAGDKAENVVPVFISVDPDRDTPDQLKEYTALFHERMEGLTGTKLQIDDLVKKFRVHYQIRKDIDPENYPVDHSSFFYLMDDQWNLVAVFRHNATAAQIANVLKQLP